jgi:hypothetical protein
MKKIYIEPKAVLLNLDVENPLCTATPVGGRIKSDLYENVEDKPIGKKEDPKYPGWEPAITAKGYDDVWVEDEE